MKFYSAGKGRVGEELHSKTFIFFFRGVWFCSPIPLDFNLLPTVQPKRPVSKCWERSPALAPARTQHLNLLAGRAGGTRHQWHEPRGAEATGARGSSRSTCSAPALQLGCCQRGRQHRDHCSFLTLWPTCSLKLHFLLPQVFPSKG